MRATFFRGTLFAAILALALPSGALAQQLTPQQRLMARRAAELDAYRKLAETVQGFQISSKTKVKDFVTESDEVNSQFKTFIRGVRIVGDPVYNPDGTVEVTAAVTLAQVIRQLKRIVRRHYVGDQYTDESIDKIKTFVKKKVITATGYGAPPPPKKVQEDPDFTGKNEPAPEPEPERAPARPRWIYKAAPTAGLEGWSGVTGQGRLMAVRAAEVDAVRKLGETINGIQISSKTKVKDFVTESDEIKSQMQAFLKGVKRVGEPTYNPDGTVEVHMAVTLAQVIKQIKRIVKREYTGSSYQDIEYKKVTKFTKKKVIEATGYGAPPDKFKLPEGAHFVGWDSPVLRGAGARYKLMAYGGARKIAQARFAERVGGLEVLSGTYVKDMVTESDVVMTRMVNFLRGTKDVGDIIFYSDGSVEARIGATFRQIIAQVKIPPQPAGLSADELLRRIKIFEKNHFFYETGGGALPSKRPFFTTTPLPPNPPAKPTDPEWKGKIIRATGYGAPRPGTSGGQAKLLAQRAALMDAYRKLSEQIYGLKIKGETTVRDFVTENDVVESETAGFIRGAKEVDRKENPDGTWEVTVEVNTLDLYRIIRRHMP